MLNVLEVKLENSFTRETGLYSIGFYKGDWK
jgi:hypothetical protein